MLNYKVPLLKLWKQLCIGVFTSFAAGILASPFKRKMYLTANLVASVMTYIPAYDAWGFDPASSHPNNNFIFFNLLDFHPPVEAVA